jgi:hypothetical protein
MPDRRSAEIGIAFIFLVSLANPAAAGRMDSIYEFLQDYERATDEARYNHKLLIQGMIDGFSWSTTYIEGVRKQKGLYCTSKLVLAADQVMELVRRAVREDESLRTKPIGYAVFHTLQSVFPCR